MAAFARRSLSGRLVTAEICQRWLALALAVMLSAGLAARTVGETSGAAPSNQVQGVRPFQLDLDSGSMALHALGACLEAGNEHVPYQRLAAVSGTVFKFVYDTTEAYQPLRDLFPTDVLKTASAAVGFIDAHWEMDKPIEAVKEIVRQEVDKGRPVIAPFLKNDAYHGFFIITGYDFGRSVFYIQGAFADSSYVAVPIPEAWSGPTASPMGWATNPVFVLGERATQSPARDLDKDMVATAIDLLRGGQLKYGLSLGEQAYMASPGPHEAAYGIPAYSLLARDVATRPLIIKPGGVDSLDFGLIWRLDAELGQLQQDRKYGADALDLVISRVGSGKSLDVQALAENVERTSADAHQLRKIFWDEIPPGVNTVDGLAQYIRSSKSIVLSLAGRDRFFENLQGLGFRAFKSPWGPVIIDDSHEKRLGARLLVKSLESRERASLRMFTEIAGFVGPDVGAPEVTPAKGHRHIQK